MRRKKQKQGAKSAREGETGGMQTMGRSMKCDSKRKDVQPSETESWKESRLI